MTEGPNRSFSSAALTDQQYLRFTIFPKRQLPSVDAIAIGRQSG